ncbi:MAG: hypothetical protein IPM29_17095 [Planctomycetes bacterium]|nr:hypothetical protein [Planctomycetota bacterium]
MYDSQILIAKSAAYSVYSPWFPRSGDYLTVTLEVTAVDGAEIKVEVFTKNREDSGDGDNAQTGTLNITRSTIGIQSETWRSGPGSGSSTNATLDELVRYKFTITTTTPGKWIAFRMLPPVWFDATGTS